MTRALVIGSSHVGALRRAAPEFAAANPDIELAFFGVRGPCYLGGRFDGSGVFQPAYGKQKDRDLALAANGAETVSAEGFDSVLMIGHRFGFPGILALMEDLDILEGGRSGRAGLVPQGLVDEVIAHVTSADAHDLAAATEAVGPVTLALAPFPSPGISAFAGRQDFARMVTAFWDHPQADDIYALWRDEVTHRVETLGHRMLWQPDSTTDGPYRTTESFATNAANHDAQELRSADHRHMNADYGRAVLDTFATSLADAGTAASRRVQA